MGEYSKSFWDGLDAQLAAEEAQIERQKQFLDDAVEESLTYLDEHLHSLPVEEHEAALEGLRKYEATLHTPEQLMMGWARFI